MLASYPGFWMENTHKSDRLYLVVGILAPATLFVYLFEVFEHIEYLTGFAWFAF